MVTHVETAWMGQFEPTPDSVAAVRHIVESQLEHVSPTCREAAVLVVSELATNVVRHARTPYAVRLDVGQTLSIKVTDTGPGTPQLLHGAPVGSGGLGLQLVSALAVAWGVEQQAGAKTVWAELPV
jgi:anti-sigma regulatory factor (Ser/Thr protein kinase)